MNCFTIYEGIVALVLRFISILHAFDCHDNLSYKISHRLILHANFLNLVRYASRIIYRLELIFLSGLGLGWVSQRIGAMRRQ